MSQPFTPRPHQRLGITFLREHARCNLWATPGSGKTSMVYAVLEMLKMAGSSYFPCLIIAPKAVCEMTWPAEQAKWTEFNDLRVVQILGDEQMRVNGMLSWGDVYLINYENLPWLIQQYAGKPWPFRIVVADESTKIKGFRSSQGTKRAKALSTIAQQTGRWINLTGTPSPNGYRDLWGQQWFVDFGQRLGDSYAKYTRRWFVENPYTHQIELRHPACKDEIDKLLADCTLSIRAEDWMQVAAPNYVEREVRLPQAAMALYKQMERDFWIEIKQLEARHEVTAVNAAALSQKLLQLCIAEGTEVLTEDGWLPIESVHPHLQVWDGVEWVNFSKLLAQGRKRVVECFGVAMTPNHLVLTDSGWVTAQEILDGHAGERLDRADFRLPDGSLASRVCNHKEAHNRQRVDEESHLECAMHLRQGVRSNQPEPTQQAARKAEVLRLSSRRDASGGMGHSWHEPTSVVQPLDQNAQPLQQPLRQGLQKLWRARHKNLRALGRLRALCSRYVAYLLPRCGTGPQKQRPGVQPAKLPVGGGSAAGEQPANEHMAVHPKRADDNRASRTGLRLSTSRSAATPEARLGAGQGLAYTFDLAQAGPRNRYVIRPKGGGRPLVVHNCSGSIIHDGKASTVVHTAKLEALESIADELQEPLLVTYWYRAEIDMLKKHFKDIRIFSGGQDEADWNAGKIKLMALHPQSAGHGINLQYGGRAMAHMTHTWNAELREQVEARIAPLRQQAAGLKRAVIHYNLVAAGTIDRDVLERVKNKLSVQEALLRAHARGMEGGLI